MPNAIFLPSPFQTDDKRHIPVASGMTIEAWLAESRMIERMHEQPVVIYRNREELLEESWGEMLQDDDLIVMAALPQDPATWAAIGTWLSANWGYFAVLALAVGISYLTRPEFEEGNPADSNQNLSIRGNRARLGQPKPVVFGTWRSFPDFSALPFVEFNWANDQVWTMLFELTLGEATVDTSTMRFEDTLLSNFQGIQYEVLAPGVQSTLYPSQVITSSEVAGFDVVGTIGPYSANPSATDIGGIGVDLLAPGGLYRQRSSGAQDRIYREIRFEAREIDDAGTPVGAYFTLGTETMSGNSRTPLRRSFFYTVTPARYEVRVINVTGDSDGEKISDTIQWGQLRGYIEDDLPAPQSTRIAMRVRSSEQIGNRALSKFNVVLTRKLRSWSTGGGWSAVADSNSIAWAYAEVATASYGGKRGDAFIDLPALEAFDAATPAGYECNGMIDSKMTVWDALKRVGQCNFATPIDPDGVLTLVKDEAQAAETQLFNMRNIIRGSFQIARVGVTEQTPDHVIIEFFDEDQDYRLTEIKCTLTGETELVPFRQKLWGVTNATQAWEIGIFMAAENKYRRAQVEFESGLETRIPTYGDTIIVSHLLLGQEGFDQVSSDVTAYNASTKVLTLTESGLTGRFTSPYVILRDLEGEPRGPYVCTVVADNQIDITDAQFPIDGDSYLTFSADYELPKVSIGEGNVFTATAKVVEVAPTGPQTYRIKGFIEEPSVYTAASGETQPSAQQLPALVDRTPTVSNLVAELRGTVSQPTVTLTWEGDNSDKYEVEYSVDSGSTWIDANGAENTIEERFVDTPQPGTVYYRVAGISAYRGQFEQVIVDTSTLSAVDPSQNSYFEDFSDNDLQRIEADWSGEIDVGGESSLVVDTDSPIGQYVWQLGNNTGDDEVSLFLDYYRKVPIKDGIVYKVTFVVSRESGSGNKFYAGVRGYEQDGETLVAERFFSASNIEPSLNSYITYVGYFVKNGQAGTDNGGVCPANDPGILDATADFVVPVFYSNRDNQAGQYRIAYIEIAESEANGRPGLPGFGVAWKYDDAQGASAVGAAGQYQFSTNLLNDTNGTLAWSDITSNTVQSIWLDEFDADSTDVSADLSAVIVGDVLVFYDTTGRWVEYEVTSLLGSSGGATGFGVGYVEHDETDGSGAVSETADTIYWRLGRAFNGVDGDSQAIRQVNLYKLNDSTLTDSTQGTFADPKNGLETGWDYSVPSITADGDEIYVIERTFTDDAQSPQDANWSGPSLYATRVDGSTGPTGQGSRYPSIYRLNFNSINSSNGTYADPLSGNTSWSYDVPALATDGDIVYVATRFFTSDGVGQDASWSTPAIYAQRTDGAAGNNGASLVNLWRSELGKNYSNFNGIDLSTDTFTTNGTTAIETSTVKEGSRSVSHTSTSTSEHYFHFDSNSTGNAWTIPEVKTDTRLLFGAWVYAVDSTNTNFSLYFNHNDAGLIYMLPTNELGNQYSDVSATGQWELLWWEEVPYDTNTSWLGKTSGTMSWRWNSSGAASRTIYVDGLMLFDVTDSPQITPSNPPNVGYVPISVNGADGRPGLPGASTVFTYDRMYPNVPAANGDYGFYDSVSPQWNNTWALLTGNTTDRFYLWHADKNGNNISNFLDSLEEGSTVTWYESDDRWVEFLIGAGGGTGGFVDTNWRWIPATLLSFNETGGTADPVVNPSTADVGLRFSTGADGRPGLPSGSHIVTYDDANSGLVGDSETGSVYNLVRNTTDGAVTTGTGANSWLDITGRSVNPVTHLRLQGNSEAGYLRTIVPGDHITFYDVGNTVPGRWVEYLVTSVDSSTYTHNVIYAVDLVEYFDNGDSSTALSYAGANDVNFMFSRGRDGRPGLPGASTILIYDEARSGTETMSTLGQYKFSDGSGGTLTWAAITGGTFVSQIELNDADDFGVDQSAFLSEVVSGDTITWFESDRRWVEFRVNGTPTENSGVFTFPVELVEYDEADGNGNLSGSPNLQRDIRFSRAQSGADGAPGAPGSPGDPGDPGDNGGSWTNFMLGRSGKSYGSMVNIDMTNDIYAVGTGASYTKTAATVNYKVGTQSLRLETTSSGGDYLYVAFQPDNGSTENPIILTAGRRWMIGAWIRANNTASDFQLYLNRWNGSSTEYARTVTGTHDRNVSTINTWQQVWWENDLTSGSYTTDEDWTLGLRFGYGGVSGRIGQIDAIMILDVTDVPQYDESTPPPVVYAETVLGGVDFDETVIWSIQHVTWNSYGSVIGAYSPQQTSQSGKVIVRDLAGNQLGTRNILGNLTASSGTVDITSTGTVDGISVDSITGDLTDEIYVNLSYGSSTAQQVWLVKNTDGAGVGK